MTVTPTISKERERSMVLEMIDKWFLKWTMSYVFILANLKDLLLSFQCLIRLGYIYIWNIYLVKHSLWLKNIYVYRLYTIGEMIKHRDIKWSNLLYTEAREETFQPHEQ